MWYSKEALDLLCRQYSTDASVRLGIPVEVLIRPLPPLSGVDAREWVERVCAALGLPVAEVVPPAHKYRKRVAAIILARQLICYTLYHYKGMTLMAIAAVLRLDHTSVIYHKKKTEGLLEIRDSKMLEAWAPVSQLLLEIAPNA